MKKVNSFIRGYHEYKNEWKSTSGNVYKLMREPNNVRDLNAVAVVREKSGVVKTSETVDVHPNNLTNKFEVFAHVPKLMASWLSKFLKRPTYCGKVIIKGKRVNRGGDFGLEVPYEFLFQGDGFCCG